MNLTRRQIAISASLAFHAVLAVCLFLWYVPGRSPGPSSPVAGMESAASDPGPPANDDPVEMAPQPAEVSDREIERSIESQIESAERLTDERKLSELEKNLKRLESVADAGSVQEVTTRIAGTLGLDAEQYAEKPSPAEGRFEIDTSQLSDVERTKTESGGWKYVSVMVDAEGREMRVPLTPAEGEQLYETFELMKRYPMADGIYRSVVMPMMQKVLEAQQMEFDLPEMDRNSVDDQVVSDEAAEVGVSESE